MAEYIFYTAEGFTKDPQGNNVENCQLLGIAFGNNEQEAKENLLKENSWITKQGFDINKAICRDLSPCKNANKVISYLTGLLDEKQLYKFSEWKKKTIFWL